MTPAVQPWQLAMVYGASTDSDHPVSVPGQDVRLRGRLMAKIDEALRLHLDL
ncbi:MAG: hypothetical protein ACYCST_04895 [Acidimicrobiales bacterium]